MVELFLGGPRLRLDVTCRLCHWWRHSVERVPLRLCRGSRVLQCPWAGRGSDVGVFLKPVAARFSEVPVGWPCGNAGPMEVKAFLAD